MPKLRRDSRLETRDARTRLAQRHEPYWRQIEPGLFLGYRKGARGGVWMLRRAAGERYRFERIAGADDFLDANGIDVLSFAQAQRHAMARADSSAHLEAAGADPDYTVADAMRDYTAWFTVHRKGLYQVQGSANRHILPKLGDRRIAALTARELRAWHTNIARSRTKSTANRVLTVLKAALNRAWEDGLVTDSDAWRRVKPFKGADRSRARWLTVDECRRLRNACPSDFRALVHGALMTGARYGELIALRIGDYDEDSATVTIAEAKSRTRAVYLTNEGRRLFDELTVGRPAKDPVFVHVDSSAWARHHQIRRMQSACEQAHIDPPVSFHVLRHTFASLLIRDGVPLAYVAAALGHTSTRMVEHHYGHLAPSHVAETLRASIPDYELRSETPNIAALSRGRRQGSG